MTRRSSLLLPIALSSLIAVSIQASANSSQISEQQKQVLADIEKAKAAEVIAGCGSFKSCKPVRPDCPDEDDQVYTPSQSNNTKPVRE